MLGGLATAVASAPPTWQIVRLASSAVVLFLQSDLGVTTGATFTWVDNSVKVSSVSQSTAILQPTYNASGGGGNKPTIQFPGGSGNQRLVGPSLTYAQPLHAFWCGRTTQSTTTAYAFDCGNNENVVFQNAGALTTDFFAGSAAAGPSLTLNTDCVYEVSFNGASSFARINGGTKTTANCGANSGTGGFTVGNFQAGGNAWGGLDLMIVLCAATLDDLHAHIIRSWMYTYGAIAGGA